MTGSDSAAYGTREADERPDWMKYPLCRACGEYHPGAENAAVGGTVSCCTDPRFPGRVKYTQVFLR